jgi:hypothetical protein
VLADAQIAVIRPQIARSQHKDVATVKDQLRAIREASDVNSRHGDRHSARIVRIDPATLPS